MESEILQTGHASGLAVITALPRKPIWRTLQQPHYYKRYLACI